MTPNGGQQAQTHSPANPTRRPEERAVPMAQYKERLLREVGPKQAAKIQMSPPKLSVERRAPSASLISRRGMTSGCYPVKANIDSIKPALTHGYWSSRVHVRCAARVSDVRLSLFRVNLVHRFLCAGKYDLREVGRPTWSPGRSQTRTSPTLCLRQRTLLEIPQIRHSKEGR